MEQADVTLYARFAAHLDDILTALEAEGLLAPGIDRKPVAVEPPRDPSHGDLATNAAMVLAKKAGTNPRALAELLAPRLEAMDDVVSAEIAGPGFINIRLDRDVWRDELAAIVAEGHAYGRSTLGQGQRVNVEYVSANPTGPMHMGHCRGALVGDALASLLEHAGYAVTREYYVNDAGAQVDVLARSAYLRYLEALGRQIGEIPEGLYPGDYLKPVGEALAAEFGETYADAPEAVWLEPFRRRTVAAMIELIKADLATLGVHHDLFASEREVQESGAVDRAFEILAEKGVVYTGTLPPPAPQFVVVPPPVPPHEASKNANATTTATFPVCFFMSTCIQMEAVQAVLPGGYGYLGVIRRTGVWNVGYNSGVQQMVRKMLQRRRIGLE